jgi:hypothetical protein
LKDWKIWTGYATLLSPAHSSQPTNDLVVCS